MKSRAKRRKSAPNGSLELKIILPPGTESCAEVFLILPGLNLNPAKLQPLLQFLLAQGHAVACPELQGFPKEFAEGFPGGGASHQSAGGLAAAWGSVSAQGWLADLDRAGAQLRTRHPNAAISLLGYSMGGLLGLVWSLTRRQSLQRAILLAPALGLRRHLAAPLAVLCALLPRRLRLPSLAPAEYLAHRGTSLATYRALLELLGVFREAMHGREAIYSRDAMHSREAMHGREALQSAPEHIAARLPGRQLLAYSPRDELISTHHLDRYAAQGGADITTHKLAHSPPPGATHHLGIDAHTLGDSEWAALLAALQAWLAD